MNKTINQLDEIASAELTDEAVIFDLSESDTKKMTMQKAFNAMHKLSATSVADSADELALYDSANNVTKKITKQNLLSEIQPPIIASSATFSGPAVEDGLYIKVIFTSAISGSDTVTPFEITYNGNSVPVKVMKSETASDILAHEVATSDYKYLQAMVTFEMVYSSAESAFILVGNPIVLSSNDYTIYADGQIRYADENKLSDFENITISTSSASPTVADYDGFIVLVSTQSDGGGARVGSIYINGVLFPTIQYTNSRNVNSFTIPIVKGDSLYFGSNANYDIKKARWYKKRDYSNR